MSEDYAEEEAESETQAQLDDDGLSAGEEGFMRGYEEADEIEKKAEEEEDDEEDEDKEK